MLCLRIINHVIPGTVGVLQKKVLKG